MLLPIVFHALHLGHVFMPMYLPLVALAFFVSPLRAAVTAATLPLLSSFLTGMPPFFPPIAPVMALELGAMGGIIAASSRAWPQLPVLAFLVPVLLFGRILHTAVMYLVAEAWELPAGFLAGLSFLSGWPGIMLMCLVVPLVVRAGHRLRRHA
jgi:hypothetical protein